MRKITLIDSGKVSMSNPLRQSLYTLDDCLSGGKFKAEAAAESLKRIFPAVVIKFSNVNSPYNLALRKIYLQMLMCYTFSGIR